MRGRGEGSGGEAGEAGDRQGQEGRAKAKRVWLGQGLGGGGTCGLGQLPIMLIMGISSGCSTSKCRSSFAASSCSSSKTDGGTQDGLTMCDRKTSAVAPAGAAICSAPETQAEPDPKTGGSGTLALRSRAWLSCWPPHCQSTASLMLLLLHCTCDMCMRMSAHARARLACCERHARLESYVSVPLEMRATAVLPLCRALSSSVVFTLLPSLCSGCLHPAVFTGLSCLVLGCHGHSSPGCVRCGGSSPTPLVCSGSSSSQTPAYFSKCSKVVRVSPSVLYEASSTSGSLACSCAVK